MWAHLLISLILSQGSPTGTLATPEPTPSAAPTAAPIPTPVMGDPAAEAAAAEERAAAAEAIELTATLEPQTVKLGDPTILTITAKHPEGIRLFFPAAPELTPFRVLEPAEGPERSLTENQVIETWTLRVRPLRMGRRKIPPIAIDFESAGGQTGMVYTQPVAANVEGRLDMEQAEVSLAGNDLPMPVYDTNWFLILLLASLGVIGLTALLTFFAVRYVMSLPRRGPPPPLPRPAHLIAQERITLLESQRLLVQGRLKEYVFGVSEILREYLGNRLHVDTLELTTSELLNRMRSADLSGLSMYELEDFLQSTDLVKFANFTPTHAECTEKLDSCKRLIEKTRRSELDVHGMIEAEVLRRKREKPAHPFKRVFAITLDLALYSVLSTGLILAARGSELPVLHWVNGILFLAFLLLRDCYGPGSPGKVLAGLSLAPFDRMGWETLQLPERVARNLTLLLPIAGHTMELVVMVYAADGRRVGDRWAGTRVLDKRPDTSEHSALLLAILSAGALVAIGYLLPFQWMGG